MSDLISTIESAWKERNELTQNRVEPSVQHAIEEAIDQLDSGQVRVASCENGQWLSLIHI